MAAPERFLLVLLAVASGQWCELKGLRITHEALKCALNGSTGCLPELSAAIDRASSAGRL
jgi:hypothetical protein